MADGRDDLDELFGGANASEPTTPPPTRVRALVIAGFVLTVLGPTCFTGVPGAGLALWAWYRADEDLARAEAGALPPDAEASVRKERRVAFAGVVFAMVLLVIQLSLFARGAYDVYVAFLAGLLNLALGGEAPLPPTP